jgi:hypothetical protein
VSDDPIRAIADAVLYEGYILWPYRRSALKNQRRFTFGGVYPPVHTAAHPDDPAAMQAEVLVSDRARVSVAVRVLQVVTRAVVNPVGVVVDELVAGDQRWQSWEEAVEREIVLELPGAAAISIPAGTELEPLPNRAGALRRSWPALSGSVTVAGAPAAPGYQRVRVRVENTTPFAGASREEAVRLSFCSTHALLRASGGTFCSLTDPPDELAGAARACENVGVWPVLVGEPGSADAMLASPIILEDHPRVAAESPGDLFDGGEIDGMLVLNILALTDEEKAHMAACDPRAREILERTEALSAEQRLALHGTVRALEVGG